MDEHRRRDWMHGAPAAARQRDSCDIRGSSPSSRELAHLDPDRRLTEVHAILLTGASAFGLAAADGVVRWLEQRGIGYQAFVPIPIVPAAVIFDAAAGDPDARPGPGAGWAACDAAVEAGVETGRVGAGTGATVGKWAGLQFSSPGGLGIGRAEDEGLTVTALAVVNAVGDVVGPDGSVIAGTTAPNPRYKPPPPPGAEVPTNTVLAVVVTQGPLDKRDARWLAARGSDGIATAVRPAHTRRDGDVVIASVVPAAADTAPPMLDVLGYLATRAVADAIRRAVG